MKNIFYFTISANFKNDYNISKFEKLLGFKNGASSVQKDTNQAQYSKYLYKTENFDGGFPALFFAEFVENLLPKARDIKRELIYNLSELTFSIVFENASTKSNILLSEKTMAILSTMGANFRIEFIEN